MADYVLAIRLVDGKKKVLPRRLTPRAKAEEAAEKWRSHRRVAQVTVTPVTPGNIDSVERAGYSVPPELKRKKKGR